MTPKFTYDPDHNCLREVARMEEPVMAEFKTNAYWTAMDVYNLHIASLRVIPCATVTKWPEGELEEGLHFRQTTFFPSFKPFAVPNTPQPRLYTQAEADEIWRAGYDCGHAEAAREDYIDKEQYFKTRFNVEL